MTTPTSPTADEIRPGEPTLVRALGGWALAAGIVSITIGSGIFRAPGVVAGMLGPAAPVGYIAAALAMGLVVLCFAEAGSRVSLTGGPYAYVEVAFGSYAGFLTGAINWVGAGLVASAAVATAFAGILGDLVPVFATPVGRAAAIILLYAVPSWINVRGVRGGGRLNVAMTMLKIVPLVAFVLVGAFAMHRANFTLTTAPTIGKVANASFFLVFAFAGMESALVPSGEVKDFSRTVPRALLWSIAMVTVIYVAVQGVAQGILGPALATSTAAPLSAAAAVSMGASGRLLLSIGGLTSMAGYAAAITLSQSRQLYAFGSDGFLPAFFARVHPAHRTPVRAIWTQSAIVVLLALTGTFEALARVANASILVLYLLCCAASWQLRRKDVRMGGEPFRVPAAPVVTVLAMALCLWLLSGAERADLYATAALIVVTIPVYFLTAAHRARRRAAMSAPLVT